MKKEFYKSMTFWGAVLLGVSVTLKGLAVDWPTLLPIAQGLGALLGVFGIRRAVD